MSSIQGKKNQLLGKDHWVTQVRFYMLSYGNEGPITLKRKEKERGRKGKKEWRGSRETKNSSTNRQAKKKRKKNSSMYIIGISEKENWSNEIGQMLKYIKKKIFK